MLAKRWVTGIVVLTVVPSIFFGYRLVKKDEFLRNASRFVNRITLVEGAYFLKHDVDPSEKRIVLVYGGRTLSDAQKANIVQQASDFHLADAALEFQQGFTIGDVGKELTQAEALKAEIHCLKALLQISEQRFDSLVLAGMLGKQLVRELQPLFPEIVACAVTQGTFFDTSDSAEQRSRHIVVFKSKNVT